MNGFVVIIGIILIIGGFLTYYYRVKPNGKRRDELVKMYPKIKEWNVTNLPTSKTAIDALNEYNSTYYTAWILLLFVPLTIAGVICFVAGMVMK